MSSHPQRAQSMSTPYAGVRTAHSQARCLQHRKNRYGLLHSVTICACESGVGRMAEDDRITSLPRRVPRDTRHAAAESSAVHLPESTVRRIRRVLDDVRADAASQDGASGAEQPVRDMVPAEPPPFLPQPSQGARNEAESVAQIMREAQLASSAGIRPEEAPTEPLPAVRVPGSGAEEQDHARQPGTLPARPMRQAGPSVQVAGRRRITRAVTLAITLLSAGTLVSLLAWHAATTNAHERNLTRTSSVGAIREQAAGWVAAQVSPAVTVSCDRTTCQALRAHGFPASSLLELRPGQADPLRSRILVLTAAVRRVLKGRFLATYAPAAVAGFGSGSARISIRLIAPHGAAAYSSSLRADLQARRAAGASLLENQQISVSAVARSQLARGQIDSRLLAIIASLAARRMVVVVSFGDLAPGASPGTPFRSADLAAPGTPAGPDAASQVQRMAAFARAQQAPYLAANIQRVRLATGRICLRIEFAAPSPLGLLAAPRG
jgi:hypothetical protein